MVDNKFLSKLSQNLLEILDDDEYYDVTIEVGNDPYVKVFRAHMIILNYRSPYLRRILSTNKKKSDGTLIKIKLSNILPEIFQIVLRYIYGGRLSLDDYDTSDIFKILVTANELNLQELIPYLESFLIENKTNWMEQNFDLIYKTCFEIDSFLELQKYCTDLISKEPIKIFNSPNFSSIPEKLLISLIQNNNLQINEIQVWELVLKWGLAQNPGLPTDPTSFSKDDFNSLMNTLQQCISFIKFHNLSSKEFLKKVLPYKKILPKELYKDLLNYFLDNDYNSVKNEHSIAQITLGNFYENGENIEKNLEKAIYWYNKAAENGNDVAQYNLGKHYRLGKGVEKDEVKAFEYYKKSADQGYLCAQFQLGQCYDKGIGIEVNKTKAFELYKTAAEKGHINAQIMLGNLYENGDNIEKNLEKAIYWYNKASENGNDEAQYNLGRCYVLGIGVEKNEAESFEYFKKSADQGYLNAQFILGNHYYNGIGTEVNKAKSFEYYEIAAEKGQNIAQNNLGILYEKGEGTEKNLKKAVYWFQKAAECGNEFAQHNLGMCYRFGMGVKENNVKAFELYKIAAEKGHNDAQKILGYLYENGEGTEKNLEKAAYWFQVSAENKNK
ncbi:hypothetical protein C1645_818259 [Glomus cerebriforme]|uniref:BTB domain-containing protein n=1 Tax=Glomus cerebriforme TaxID=658196 RepID=A0A397TA90_9GLOM|nr:hypothetical protein C1645_818259 [Glomus cerebriforme]